MKIQISTSPKLKALVLRLLASLPPLLISTNLSAEYRAFWLGFEGPNPSEFRTIISSLDPVQYPGYYPVPQNTRIRLLDTWMCRGRTNHLRDFCPSPRKSETEAQIQTENQKRGLATDPGAQP